MIWHIKNHWKSLKMMAKTATLNNQNLIKNNEIESFFLATSLALCFKNEFFEISPFCLGYLKSFFSFIWIEEMQKKIPRKICSNYE